ncbi:sensory/regulatory protein RpfC [Clostridium puniceum]|uniref:Stage 0 sporulation protein A homolog n=1 Tax=Clostridium puniceum TaxID=29367 RepID=A0A1S8TMP8_9CLOT|nr:ATP-binding protein [Clostridium puniceum]OOM79043.1 sensory/regulatory protein RpfC [Clostridium puniceum]
MKNKGIAIWAGLIIIVVFLISNVFSKDINLKSPLCKEGLINLSDWDFEGNGNVKLDGYWEFYPNKLLSPIDINDQDLLEKFYIKIPDRWVNQVPDGVISDKGVGTYRLKVKTNEDTYMYGLKITNIRSSCKIFINGIEMGKIGNPKADLEDGYLTKVLPFVTFFPSKDNTLDIIIQVANLEYYNGGIIQSIYLGSDKNILDYYLKANILDMLDISFLLLSGAYYLVIFIKVRKDKYFKYMGIICLAYSYVYATGNEKIFSRFFNFIPYLYIIKSRTTLVCLTIYFISLSIREMSNNFIPINYMKVIKVITIMNIILTLLIPTRTASFLEILVGLLNVLIFILIFILILRAFIYKQYGNVDKKLIVFLLCGIIIMAIQYINWILYFFSISSNNILMTTTFNILLISISAIFIRKYVKAYSDLEIMSNNLIALDKTKDEFLVNTSHEFKTPLNAIINISQAILDRYDKNKEKNQENLLYIIAIATRLSNLVKDIIDFENLQNGQMKFNKTIFDINGTVQAVVDVLSYMRRSEEIKLINSIPVGEYYVYSDENRIKQIIYNIVGNSLKYTEKGYIEIKANTIDNYVYLSVEDTGTGINQYNQNNLFKRNIDTGKINFNNSTSSGLGLSISKVLASNMGGDLYLKWSELDKGSIFEIKIPKAHNEMDEKKLNQYVYKGCKENISIIDKNKNLKASTILHKKNIDEESVKILIVDDESLNIKALQEIFDENYYETIVAYNGMQALELIKKHKDIEIVLLDVMMPGISGYEVCKRIRQEYKMFEIPILLLTVRNTPEDIEAGLEAGANDFLVKPFNSKELKARVKTLLEMKASVKGALKIESAFLQSQIKPHFLYNSLSIIVSLCYSDGELAGKLLGELSKYLRFIFDINPYNSFISLKEEISFVKTYVELERARFGDRLKIKFNIDETVLNYKIPALVIQPIVENSIRHGLMKRISGGTVNIVIEKNNNHIRITIQDDGVGIYGEKLKKLLDNTFTMNSGLKNVNKRLLNEYGQGLLIDSSEGKGTNTIINIPVEQ